MKLKENRKLQIVVFVVSMVVLITVYIFSTERIKRNKLVGKIANMDVAENNMVMAEVEDVSCIERELRLSGWVVKVNSEIQDIKMILVPVNAEELSEIVLDTELTESKEQQEYSEYLNVKDTIGSGFCAKTEVNNLKEDICYEIGAYINYASEVATEKDTKVQESDETKEQVWNEMMEGNVKISSLQYLYNGELYEYNPLVFEEPLFHDELMAKVICNGEFVGYTAESGAWVYFYEGYLYWILDKKIECNKEKDLYIFFHLHTPHGELLPEWRKQYGFDNRDFKFEEMEVMLKGDDTYRVAKVAWGYGYPVTYITTGHYLDGKNLWVIRNKVRAQ